MDLINLLDGGASTAAAGSGAARTGHTSRHPAHVGHTSGATRRRVQFGDDRVAYTLHLLLLVLELLNLCQLVGVKPLDSLVALVVDSLLVIVRYLVLNLLIIHGCLHVETIALETILGADSLLLLLVIGLVLLSIVHHSLNLFFGQTALVIGDGDLILLAGALVTSRHVQDTISVNVEGDFDLWDAAGRRRDSGQIELAEQMV